MTETNNTVVVVTKNADFTEGRGPMLFHSVWADMATADAYIMRQHGIYGGQQGVSKYGRLDNTDGSVNYNGYTATPVPLRGLEGVLSPEREAEIKQELSDLDAAMAELKAHRSDNEGGTYMPDHPMTDTTEGRRLLEAQRAATEARWKCERGETAGHLGELLAAETRAIELLEAWTDEHLEALLSAAEAGKIEFCGDSTHALTGQTVMLPDLPTEARAALAGGKP